MWAKVVIQFLALSPHSQWALMYTYVSLLFRAAFKWRLQENRFFLVFGLIIHFMATTTKAKRCIFISRTPKCPGYRSILNKSRRYRLFSALLRSQFGPIRIPFSWLSEMQCFVYMTFIKVFLKKVYYKYFTLYKDSQTHQNTLSLRVNVPSNIDKVTRQFGLSTGV